MRRTLAALCALFLLAAQVPAHAAMWVTAYYVGWRQRYLPPEQIDFNAITHLIHFGAHPSSDGTLNADVNLLNRKNVASAIGAAHRAGRKILFTVGGEGSREEFLGAISDAHRSTFIGHIVDFLKQGYDGVDIDMEEIDPQDHRAYGKFIRELRGRLDEIHPRPLLTAAARWEPALFARLAPKFDQINLMTYDLSGPYSGWVVWHSGALFDGGRHFPFPNSSRPLPSIDGIVKSFLVAGVPPEKLGIGLCFDGYIWSGGDANRPNQAWSKTPSMKDVPYYELADTYHIKEYDYSNPLYHWDSDADAPYLAIDGGDRQFVSYDNEVAIRKKIRYAREKGIGGVFVWELAGGYRRDQPAGQRDLLLQAVKQSALLR